MLGVVPIVLPVNGRDARDNGKGRLDELEGINHQFSNVRVVQVRVRGRPRHRQGHLITYVADSIGCVQIAVPPQVLLHGDGGCPVVLGRHDGLVAHYAGRGILAHGGGRMGEEEENELNELAGLAGWKLENS